jgi:hypothetical protein
MDEHIFLPGVRINTLTLLPEYREWLSSWLQTVERDIEQGDIAASLCLQGAMSEMALYGSPQTDWIGNMDTYLLDQEQKPIAYSEKYGQRLYKFSHWLQSEVHAIHARWWIQQSYSSPFPQAKIDYGALFEQLIQPGGWIYNSSVSQTGIRTRMKSEYLMSLAMGVEILNTYGLPDNYKLLFESAASSVQRTLYLSAEYFRLKALEILDSMELLPVDLMNVLVACEAGKGFCDFSVKDKVDDYMGTAKRTARDLAVHSPLSSLHALYIASLINEEAKQGVLAKLIDFGRYLEKEPFGIPAFKIRDLDTPFGSDVTPLEVLAATAIITLSKQY